MTGTVLSKASTIKIADIDLGERRRQEMGDIEALAKSINEHGLLEPVSVLWQPEVKRWRLIYGGRRVAAVTSLGWTHIDAIERGDLTDEELRTLELVENVDRKDLTPIEISRQIVDRLDVAEEKIAAELPDKPSKKSGRGRPADPTSLTNVAATAGVERKTAERAKKHVDVVERYPELEGQSQEDALVTAKMLDEMDDEVRAISRAALAKKARTVKAKDVVVIAASDEAAAGTPEKAPLSRRQAQESARQKQLDGAAMAAGINVLDALNTALRRTEELLAREQVLIGERRIVNDACAEQWEMALERAEELVSLISERVATGLVKVGS